MLISDWSTSPSLASCLWGTGPWWIVWDWGCRWGSSCQETLEFSDQTPLSCDPSHWSLPGSSDLSTIIISSDWSEYQILDSDWSGYQILDSDWSEYQMLDSDWSEYKCLIVIGQNIKFLIVICQNINAWFWLVRISKAWFWLVRI